MIGAAFLAKLAAKPAVAAVGSVIGKWWKLAVGMILGAALCWPVASCSGERKGRAAEGAAWELRVSEVARAAEIAQRSADEAMRRAEIIANQRIASNRQEIDNALRDIPDQGLTARQRAVLCIRLRRENAPASAVSAACGPAQPPR